MISTSRMIWYTVIPGILVIAMFAKLVPFSFATLAFSFVRSWS